MVMVVCDNASLGWLALILGILLIAAVGGLIVFGIMALRALIKDAKRRKTIDKR